MNDISLISRPTTISSANSRQIQRGHVNHHDHISTTGFIKTTHPVRPIKKNDPVSRYHQHQAQWKKDGFLKRMDSKNPTREAGRWGGMAAIIHEQPVKV
jgi:hypothetical protein